MKSDINLFSYCSYPANRMRSDAENLARISLPWKQCVRMLPRRRRPN